MLIIATRISLIILAGVYAMRASNALFHPQPFQPLMVVALFAFIMSLVLFHNPPTTTGWWLYTVIALCFFGVAANTLLFIAPDKSHGTPINMAFSLVSIIGWAVVGMGFVAKIFETSQKVT